MVPDRESPLYRDGEDPLLIDPGVTDKTVSNMRLELERHIDSARGFETPHDPSLAAKQLYYANVPADPPLSPRQMPHDDSRRPSVVDSSRPNMIRPPVPTHLSVSSRHYGSTGAANNSPNSNRPQPPPAIPPQPTPHPLSSTSTSPNLGRRHTSADIRQHGWPPTGVSPFPVANQGGSGAPWASAPHPDQHLQESLARYQIPGARPFPPNSRNTSPPPNNDAGLPTLNVDSGWSIGGPNHPRHGVSLPATRRSSVASNVHSLLNPADTAEQPDGEEAIAEDRKRKRLE